MRLKQVLFITERREHKETGKGKRKHTHNKQGRIRKAKDPTTTTRKTYSNLLSSWIGIF